MDAAGADWPNAALASSRREAVRAAELHGDSFLKRARRKGPPGSPRRSRHPSWADGFQQVGGNERAYGDRRAAREVARDAVEVTVDLVDLGEDVVDFVGGEEAAGDFDRAPYMLFGRQCGQNLPDNCVPTDPGPA
jgi:hypothetical protein